MEEENILEKRIMEDLEDLQDYPPISEERKALVNEIRELQTVATAEYRAEVDAWDKEQQLKMQLELKREEAKANRKRFWIDIGKIAAMAGLNLFMIKRVLKVEDEGVVHTKAINFLPKPKFW